MLFHRGQKSPLTELPPLPSALYDVTHQPGLFWPHSDDLSHQPPLPPSDLQHALKIITFYDTRYPDCSLARTLHCVQTLSSILENSVEQGPSEHLLTLTCAWTYRCARGFKSLYLPLSPSGTHSMLGNQGLLGINFCPLQDVLLEWHGYISRIYMCRRLQQDRHKGKSPSQADCTSL